MKIYWRGAWLGYLVLLTLAMSPITVAGKHGNQFHPFALFAVPLLLLWVARAILRKIYRLAVRVAKIKPQPRPLHAAARIRAR